MSLYVLGTPTIRLTLLGQRLLVYDVLRWINSIFKVL